MASFPNPNVRRASEEALFEPCERSRERLVQCFARQNPALSPDEVLAAAQRTMEWLLFLRLSEERGAQRPGSLRSLAGLAGVYPRLCRGRSALEPSLALDDASFREALAPLCEPESALATAPVDMLGHVYERSLGSGTPHARKAGGVYYTPDHIVRYVVESTVGALIEGRTPAEVPRLAVLDPACGAGSFLLGTCRLLFDWYRACHGNGTLRLTTARRQQIVEKHVFGVDLDGRAVELTKLSLVLLVLEGAADEFPHEDLEALRERMLSRLDVNIRRGNSLVTAEFDYEEHFADIFAKGGFDVVIGNPPYLSYGGRQAAPLAPSQRKYFAEHYQSAGWATAHSFFMERAAKLLSRQLVSFIVPDQVGHLEGYRSLRRLLAQHGGLAEVKYWGENVFKGVVTPSLTFLLDKSERLAPETRIVSRDGSEQRGSIEPGDGWTFSSSLRLLEKLGSDATSIRPWISDCGIRTTDAKKQVVELARGSGEFVPALEGKQIGRYWCSPPEVAVLLDTDAPLFRSRVDKYAKAEFLIRQTAAYPIVGPREHATYFRNSLHALYPPDDGSDVRYLVGLLNSKVLRFVYVAMIREARQRVFPQVKLRALGALPIRRMRLDVPAERAQHDRVVEMVEAMLGLQRGIRNEKAPADKDALCARAKELDRAIDADVFRIYALSDREIARVEDTIGALASPP